MRVIRKLHIRPTDALLFRNTLKALCAHILAQPQWKHRTPHLYCLCVSSKGCPIQWGPPICPLCVWVTTELEKQPDCVRLSSCRCLGDGSVPIGICTVHQGKAVLGQQHGVELDRGVGKSCIQLRTYISKKGVVCVFVCVCVHAHARVYM